MKPNFLNLFMKKLTKTAGFERRVRGVFLDSFLPAASHLR
jgi:hypothetical protein